MLYNVVTWLACKQRSKSGHSTHAILQVKIGFWQYVQWCDAMAQLLKYLIKTVAKYLRIKCIYSVVISRFSTTPSVVSPFSLASKPSLVTSRPRMPSADPDPATCACACVSLCPHLSAWLTMILGHAGVYVAEYPWRSHTAFAHCQIASIRYRPFGLLHHCLGLCRHAVQAKHRLLSSDTCCLCMYMHNIHVGLSTFWLAKITQAL